MLFLDDASKLIIDDLTLETGLVFLVQFTTNGIRKRVYRSQMLNDDFSYLFREVHLNQESLEFALDGDEEEHEDPDVILEDKL